MARILIIDDDPELRELLAEVVRDAGHVAFLAADGREGGRLIKAKHLDLLITDIVMPQKDGLDLLLELRSRPSHLKTIVISGTPAEWTVLQSARELGADKTLPKPFTPTQLIETIDSVLAVA